MHLVVILPDYDCIKMFFNFLVPNLKPFSISKSETFKVKLKILIIVSSMSYAE